MVDIRNGAVRAAGSAANSFMSRHGLASRANLPQQNATSAGTWSRNLANSATAWGHSASGYSGKPNDSGSWSQYGGYGGHSGYGGYGNSFGFGYSPYCSYRPYSYGYGGYPWGIVARSVLLGVPLLRYGLYGGYGGYGYGYGGYGSGYQSVTYYTTNAPSTTIVTAAQPVEPVIAPEDLVAAPVDPAEAPTAAVLDYAAQGEAQFKAGDYAGAIRSWQHALVDDPNNGGLVLLVAQALFATGKYDEAAGAVQAAMQMLPEDQWGVVVSNFAELYSGQAYVDQVRALESASEKQPTSPAMHFLLGYHYGYLGHVKEAVRELEKTLELAPQDEVAAKLLATMKAQLK